MALSFIGYNSKLPATQAQTSTALTITGLVQTPLSLTLNEIEAMPQTTEFAILICVDAPTTPLEWGDWTGVQLSYLLQQANVSSDAFKVAMFAPDGFMADLTVQMATTDNNILVAYKVNNTALSGLQLVVPNNYGYKWISDLTQIQLVSSNFLGTEERLGYPDDATITAVSGSPGLPSSSLPPESTAHPTQSPTSTPTTPSQSPLPTGKPTTSPVTSSPKPQSTSTFLIYVATVSIIIVVIAVVSAATLIRRKKAKALKQEEATRASSSL